MLIKTALSLPTQTMRLLRSPTLLMLKISTTSWYEVTESESR